LNEKDLKKSSRLIEKVKKPLKQQSTNIAASPILSSSKSPPPVSTAAAAAPLTSTLKRYNKENSTSTQPNTTSPPSTTTTSTGKEKLYSSKLKLDSSTTATTSNQNRVSFSFQPTTEYLQHFRNVGLTKLGAAASSSFKSKQEAAAAAAAATDLYQKQQERINLPRSQSVITCHQSLNNNETCDLTEINEEHNATTPNNKDELKYAQHYAKFDSAESANTTTVEELPHETISFKDKESINNLKKNYKKIKNSLNVPKNISKSVEMISKSKTTTSNTPTSNNNNNNSTNLKKLDSKKNLTKINEYFSSNAHLSSSKSSKKCDMNKTQTKQSTSTTKTSSSSSTNYQMKK